MKQLQCNFTTPEQSKRLLELGVPADSADMWYVGSLGASGKYAPFPSFSYHFGGEIYERDLPCWSVGRLIEIMKICAKPKEQATMAEEMLYCEDLVELLVYMIEANKQVIDFSKLEE